MEIEEQFTHPTHEIDFENDEAFHEPEYEASHDVKENEEFHLIHDDDEEMQDTNIKNELDMVVKKMNIIMNMKRVLQMMKMKIQVHPILIGFKEIHSKKWISIR